VQSTLHVAVAVAVAVANGNSMDMLKAKLHELVKLMKHADVIPKEVSVASLAKPCNPATSNQTIHQFAICFAVASLCSRFSVAQDWGH
jgi:hypothetical protein